MIYLVVTQKDKDYIYNLLSDVYFPEDFGINNDTDELDCDCEILSSIDADVKIQSHYGASKYVLVDNSLSYVIKIPFDGYWETAYIEKNYKNDDEEDTDGEEDIEFIFTNFDNACNDSYADDKIYSNNYCETERRFFKVMNEIGFGVFFAETQYFDTINGKNIYLQEKVIPYPRLEKGASSPLAVKLSETPHISVCSDWIEKAIQYYGEELTKSFINFLSTDDDIGQIIAADLHYENYGYREDGSPCILDYSGFYN